MLHRISGTNADNWEFNGQNGAQISNYFIISFSENQIFILTQEI